MRMLIAVSQTVFHFFILLFPYTYIFLLFFFSLLFCLFVLYRFRLNWYFSFVFSYFIFLFYHLLSSLEPTLPNGGAHRNRIKKSSSHFKKSVSNLYARPAHTTNAAAAVGANVNGVTYLEAKGQKDFKSHPHERYQRNSDAENMDFLISQVPTTAARQEQELRNNAGVLLLNGINNNLNMKQQLMHHQKQQQHQQHLHQQAQQQKMTKKKLKLAQTQLDKLTQINIHLHGMYSILFFCLIFLIIIFSFLLQRFIYVLWVFRCSYVAQFSFMCAHCSTIMINQQYNSFSFSTSLLLRCNLLSPLLVSTRYCSEISDIHVRPSHWNLSLSLNR